MIRKTVHYRGRVQGVGFRYTATRVAGRHQVAGYVQNLPDGRVRLVAEGAADAIDAFLDDVRAELGRYVKQEQADAGDATGEFGKPGEPDTFAVRY